MQRLILGFALSLAISSQAFGGILYSEDFEDGTADGITVIYPTFQIGGGLRGSQYGFYSPNPRASGRSSGLTGSAPITSPSHSISSLGTRHSATST